MKKSNIISLLVLACFVLMPAGTYALPISGSGFNGGSFSGSIEYVPGNSIVNYIGTDSISICAADVADNAGASLIINLTNTSSRQGLYLYFVSLSSPYLAAQEKIFLDVGQTGSISFSPTDRGFSGLTAESFLNAGSEFVVYFSDVNGAIKDKALVTSVSEPFTVILLGFGLVVLGIAARRKI